MGQGIRALCKKDWAVRVVFGGEEVYSSSAKFFPNYLNCERVECPFLWRDIVPRQYVCSLVHFAWHMHRLQWAQIILSPNKKVIRQRAESLRGNPGDLCMTPRSCCMSVLAHGVPECPSWRIDRPDTLLAFLGSWSAGQTSLWAEGRFALAQRSPTLVGSVCRDNIPTTGQGWYTGQSHRYAVASVMPSRGWNPLLQPELDELHVKQTMLKYHKAQHSLESFERTGGTFLYGGRVVLNCRGSLRWESCSYSR